jgi:hypothetical protein
VFYRHLPSILYRFDVISAFVIAENGRKTISAARGRARSEVKSPFDCLTPIWYRSVLEFVSSMRPPKSTSLEQSASFEISCVQIGSVDWSVGLVTKQKTRKFVGGGRRNVWRHGVKKRRVFKKNELLKVWSLSPQKVSFW